MADEMTYEDKEKRLDEILDRPDKSECPRISLLRKRKKQPT